MIRLQKSTFYNESATKSSLCNFIQNADILSMNTECKKFEIAFAAKQNRKFAVFVNSGSSANLILIQALINNGSLNRGDVVAVSALTWATNIMPLIQLGLQPFLVDCEIDSLNVSARTLSIALDGQPKIKALFITNTLGHCDDLAKVVEVCNNRNVLLIEDNCESLGSVYKGNLLGNFGIASTFSLFVGHHLSAIEGGVTVTDSEELYEALVMCRAHGWDRGIPITSQERIRSKYGIDDFYAKYTFYDLGYNVRPTEINGFLANQQLAYWDTIVQKRFENFKRLHQKIEGNRHLIPVRYSHMEVVSSFAIPVILKDSSLFKSTIEKFVRADVEIRPMIAGNMANQPFYRKYVGNPGFQPNADYIHRNSFYFGNHPELNEEELEILSNLLLEDNR